jgi:hypothetical protein
MASRSVVVVLIVGLALAASIFITGRTVILATPYGFIEKDRLTGRVSACAVDNPDAPQMQTARNARLRETLGAAGFSESEIDGNLKDHPTIMTCRSQ